jgi:hypothetical protein
MTHLRGLICLLLLCTATSGQTVTISGPAGIYTSTSTLASGGPITLQSPWSGPAGTYQITLPANATVNQASNSVTITWGNGPTPQPPLPPAPPGPTPLLPVTPMSASLAIVCVFDRAGPPVSSTQTAIQSSKTIAGALKPLNATLVCVDVTTKTMQDWIKDARAAGIPALLVMVMGTGNKALAFEAIPLPIDEAGVIAEIKRIRGLGGTGVSPSPQMTKVVELLTEIKTTLGRGR